MDYIAGANRMRPPITLEDQDGERDVYLETHGTYATAGRGFKWVCWVILVVALMVILKCVGVW